MTQADIFQKIKEMGEGVTARELALETGKPFPSLYRNLRDLLKNERIEAVGNPKRYFIK